MQCVILAGGLGTRMLPLTKDIPKSLIKINGKPFIDYQLTLLTDNGVNDIVICIGNLGDMIQNYVGYSFNGAKVSYVSDGENLMGTGGALRKAYDESKLNEIFGVIYGDSFLLINYQEIYDKVLFSSEYYKALMTVYKNEGKFDISNVVFNSDNFILYDKKCLTKNPKEFTYIDYGFSILFRDTISNIPQNQKYGLDQLLHKISLENKLKGIEVHNRFYEIGSIEGLKDFTNWIITK